MASKTFHFGRDFTKALEDLMESYLLLTAFVESVWPIVEAEGITAGAYAVSLVECDKRFVALIRSMSKTIDLGAVDEDLLGVTEE